DGLRPDDAVHPRGGSVRGDRARARAQPPGCVQCGRPGPGAAAHRDPRAGRPRAAGAGADPARSIRSRGALGLPGDPARGARLSQVSGHGRGRPLRRGHQLPLPVRARGDLPERRAMTESNSARSGWWQSLSDLASGRLPVSLRELQSEIEDRLRKIPNRLNEYGFDPFGLSPDWLRDTALPGLLLYRYYFRVETHDIDRLPAGRVLVITNHAGQLPFDGMMLQTALLMEAEPPRIARAMGEYWIPRLPIVSFAATRMGAMVGTPHNCAQMLQHG